MTLSKFLVSKAFIYSGISFETCSYFGFWIIGSLLISLIIGFYIGKYIGTKVGDKKLKLYQKELKKQIMEYKRRLVDESRQEAKYERAIRWWEFWK